VGVAIRGYRRRCFPVFSAMDKPSELKILRPSAFIQNKISVNELLRKAEPKRDFEGPPSP
jgi:hypothetical protein